MDTIVFEKTFLLSGCEYRLKAEVPQPSDETFEHGVEDTLVGTSHSGKKLSYGGYSPQFSADYFSQWPLPTVKDGGR